MPLIDSAAALAAHCQTWATLPALALDTEFVRTQTYYAQLCLLQVGDGHEASVIDTLAVHDLTPLRKLLTNPSQVKILHACSQDLEILSPLCAAPLVPLFDTQLAAELLGEGEQLSYAALVERHLGVRLDKTLTRTDWRHRPLRTEEIAYAAADVSWLRQLYPLLRDALVSRGRLDWLREDCAKLADPLRYREEPRDAWRRLKRLAHLAPQARSAAAALAQWREETAQRADRPRRWILSDDALYAIATRLPHDRSELSDLRELPAGVARHHGDAILAVVADAPLTLSADTTDLTPLDLVQKERFERLRKGLTTCAQKLGVPRGLLANRTDLEKLVRYGRAANIPLLHGWRRRVTTDDLGVDIDEVSGNPACDPRSPFACG